MQETMLSIIEDYEIPISEAEIQADPLYKQGVDFGERKGREEGERKGREEGERKGREEGEVKAKRELAARLKDLGMSDDFIVEATGLPLDEWRQINGKANE